MKKRNKSRFGVFLKQCPLASMILVSAVSLTAVGAVGVYKGIYDLNWTMDHPIFASVLLREYKNVDDMNMENFADTDVFSPKAETISENPEQPATQGSAEAPVKTSIESSVDAPEAPPAQVPAEASAETPAASQPETPGRQEIPTQFVETEPRAPRSSYYDDPGKYALSTDYPYITVDNSYYDDAIFIGDSRIEGFHDYFGLDNAAFCYKRGLNVYDMMTEKVQYSKNEKGTVPEALAAQQYNKIFIMVGINELGRGDTAEYAMQYKENLDQIRQLQPNAVIFILGVMNVTTEYSDSSDVYNNDNINSKNVSVAGYANGIDTFYLDLNSSVADETGGMVADYSVDGIHLKAQYYSLVLDFLNQHGLEDDMFAE